MCEMEVAGRNNDRDWRCDGVQLSGGVGGTGYDAECGGF
jgi:hypothetical protein